MTPPSSPPPLPLVPGPWLPLSEAEAARTISHLDAHLQQVGLADPPFSQQCRLHSLHAVPLSFYPGWVLISGQAELKLGGMGGTFDVLLGPRFICCLDGRSTVIHLVNTGLHRAPADADDPPGIPLATLLPEGTGPDYLHFFCHAVRGGDGAFRVVETADDLRACGVTRELETFGSRLKPLHVAWKPDAPHVLAAETTLLYSGALFHAKFEIDAFGMVKMLDDDQIAADIAPAEITQQYLRNMRPTPD